MPISSQVSFKSQKAVSGLTGQDAEILFIKNKVQSIKLSTRLPAISVKDLALMLQIDLAFGKKRDFYNRLQKALNAVLVAALHSPST